MTEMTQVYNPDAAKQSMQGFSPTDSAKAGAAAYGFGVIWHPDDIIAAYELVKRCDYDLYRLYTAMHNTLLQGAITGLIKRIASTPWEIKGGRNMARRYTEMFQNAQFGEGWSGFLERVLTDYYTQNMGGVVEVIAPGDPTKPIEYVDQIGFAHLDVQRCYPTLNMEYPLVYNAYYPPEVKDKPMWHGVHATRVIRLIDAPSPREQLRGYGMCALYRATTVSNVQILMHKYQGEKLSDLPPAGILTVKGLTSKQYTEALQQYEADRQRDGQSVFRNIVQLTGLDTENPPEVKITPFAELPDNFDYRTYMEMHVNLVALALGVDKQEIWELASAGMGSATQSQVLAQKAQGRGIADIYSKLERAFNRYLPEGLEFRFKWRDAQSDKEQAERAKIWTSIALELKSAVPTLNDQVVAQLLANQVEAFADVLQDAEGVVQLHDADVTPAGEEHPRTIALVDDAKPDAPAPSAAPQQTVTTDDVAKQAADRLAARLKERIVRKDWASTVEGFVTDFTDAIRAGAGGDVTRRRFGTLARALLRRYGQQAYLDGLAAGGVQQDALDSAALGEVTKWLAEQSGYVTKFGEEVYKDGLSDAEVNSRARLWVNKSLRDIYYKALADADTNGAYRWEIGKTEEHCRDCLRLNGQVHRLKAWLSQKFRPQSGDLQCKGYNCDCKLTRTRGRSRGTF